MDARVEAWTPTEITEGTFFDRYAAALLARDEVAVAALYAVPALVLFPGQAIAVSDRTQTEEFFASSWAQSEDVSKPSVTSASWPRATTPCGPMSAGRYDGAERERFCYQLARKDDGWQVAVLTPLPL